MSEALLKYVVLRLPQRSVNKPFDATSVDLVRILSRSTDHKLIKQLLKLGMQLKQNQMEATVLLIPDEDADTFELLLQFANKNKFTLNVACVKAMDTLKINFITLLIKYGATPPADELFSVMGLSDNPTIQQYFVSQATLENTGFAYVCKH